MNEMIFNTKTSGINNQNKGYWFYMNSLVLCKASYGVLFFLEGKFCHL